MDLIDSIQKMLIILYFNHHKMYSRQQCIFVSVKKSSDKLVKQLEKEWNSEQPLSTNSERLFTILEDCLDASAAQTLVAYCDILDDARSMIKRAV